MQRIILFIFLLYFSIRASAQLTYTLSYTDSSKAVIKISIQLNKEKESPISFVMPRSVPGSYGIVLYDKFINAVYAVNSQGKKFEMVKNSDDAPRWNYQDTGQLVSRIEYEVNLDLMERKLDPSDASILRTGFAGILNYSVFGWIDGTERLPVQCHIETFSSWHVFTTHEPATFMEKGSFTFSTENYYALADGQIFLGPLFQVKKFNAIVPLFIASYSQAGDEYLDDYGWQGITSMSILNDYFGEIPFHHYCILLRKVVPLEPGNYPPFGMEHLQSATFFGDTSGIRKEAMSKDMLLKTIPTYLHHMAHSFIPLRCYGDTYKPYVLEIPPVINNIWFNEGFMWFLPYDTLHFERMKSGFENNTYSTYPALKKLSLSELSQVASTIYSTDFRIGKSVFSRGALMAIEMNTYLKEKTGGKKSMKDVLRYIYQWSKQNKRPFTMKEFPKLINEACHIDLSKIYEKWQLPIK